MLVCDGVGGAAAKTECAAIASSFFISVFSQPEKWVGKNSLFLWGCVALSKVHFIYKSKSGHCISPQHRHTVLTHANTHSCTTECPLSLSDSHRNTPFLSLPLILTHTHTHTPSVSIWTVHAMSRDRASCTVNVSAVQMINVTRFTFPNVAQIPLSSRFTFCVELTPGLQVKIAAPPCSSPLSVTQPAVPPLGYQTWAKLIFYWEKGLHMS